jgi:hypothetical protein
MFYKESDKTNIFVNNIKFEGPFYLLVVEETSGSHVGRKSLKYNNKIEIDGKSNQQFYKRIDGRNFNFKK